MVSYSQRQMFEACCVVKERFPLLPVLAIPWAYSTNHREMANRIESKKMQPSLILFTARIGLCIVRAFQWAGLIVYLRLKLRKQRRALLKRHFDGVAKTWFVPQDNTEDSKDFYVGDLQERLRQRGISVLFLSGNVICKQWASFSTKATKTGELAGLPDLCLISVFHPIWMIGNQILVFFRLVFASWFEKEPLIRRILKLASLDCMRSQTHFNALNYWIGKVATKTWKPKFFVTLYEGHGWEQCLWRGVRRIDPACKIVGYQHTVIMSHNFETLEPRESLHEKTTPDVVLAHGYRTHEMIKPGHAKFGTKLIPFGSFRYSQKMERLRQPDGQRRSILVIPEGIWEEALFLFDAVAQIASVLKEDHFILRCHPVLPFERVRPCLLKDPTRLPNVELSQKPLIEDDFARSSTVIYRGSSAILYAILMGLKPFYLNSPLLKMIDPLFELKEWKEYVDSSDLLPARVKDFYSMPLEERIASWQKATKYVQDYTIPVNERSMNQFIAAIQ